MLVSRDPFARQELHKSLYAKANSGHSCSWCGTKERKLYEYRTETDGGRAFEHSGLFCSKACHDDYHS